jgi:predicted transcriptional regulator
MTIDFQDIKLVLIKLIKDEPNKCKSYYCNIMKSLLNINVANTKVILDTLEHQGYILNKKWFYSLTLQGKEFLRDQYNK